MLKPRAINPDDDSSVRLDECLRRSADDYRRIEEHYLDQALAADWKSNLLLFGAGPLGISTLHGLRRLGIPPIAFVDNRAELWGRTIDGVRVFSPADAVREFGVNVSFVVCIWRSRVVMQQLAQLGCKSAVTFKGLFWKYPAEFLPNMRVDRPHLILESSDMVRRVFDALSDRDSRQEFTRQIEWLLQYEFDELPSLEYGEQYFEKDLFKLHNREVFVDCGAYTGDTFDGYLRHNRRPLAFHGFEPDPDNFADLSEWRERQADALREQIHLYPYAASDRRKTLRFLPAGVGSAADARGPLEIQAVTLDETLAEHSVTFIKMDIEGAELEALAGGARIIRNCRPVLAVCLYHRQDHLFAIPDKIKMLIPDCQLFIRRYGDQFGDVVCYAVPPERGRCDRQASVQ
jgi:FkbM family methyltransferase